MDVIHTLTHFSGETGTTGTIKRLLTSPTGATIIARINFAELEGDLKGNSIKLSKNPTLNANSPFLVLDYSQVHFFHPDIHM